ncbi:MAG: hypothetical protein ABIJ41_02215 [Candidatus Omnitrophota bacterium]
MIRNELDRVAGSMNQDADVAWGDVCATRIETDKDVSKNLREVEENLDRIADQLRSQGNSIQDKKLFIEEPSLRSRSAPKQVFVPLEEESEDPYLLSEQKIQQDDRAYDVAIKETPSKAFETNLNVSSGYRMDDFNWNIAGDSAGANPNVLSELKWKDLDLYQVKATGDLVFFDHFVLEGSGAYSWILNGKNKNSGYASDNRTDEVRRVIGQSDDGEVFDLSGGIGYRFYLGNDRNLLNIDKLWLTLLGGYSYHEQNLMIDNAVQEVGTGVTTAGLHYTYDTQWRSPWAGFELAATKNRLKGNVRFEYHFADYDATADWNTRSDYQHPESFIHWGEGYGLVFNAGAGYQMTDAWSLDFAADIQRWRIEDGIDRLFLANGTITDSRLNEVNWDAYSFLFGLTYQFGK